MDKPPEVTQAEWNAIVASDMTFTEIAAKWGKEVAIEAGIVRDPDAPELTAEDFARARPAVEVDREFVERWRPRAREAAEAHKAAGVHSIGRRHH